MLASDPVVNRRHLFSRESCVSPPKSGRNRSFLERAMAEDENVPVLTVEQKILLQKLKIWDKIASGNLHSIALSDVQALFDILDPGEKGHITRGECFSLLQIQNVKISRDQTTFFHWPIFVFFENIRKPW